MKIAIFSDTYPPEINGVATSVKSLHDIFIANGHEVLLVTTNVYSNQVVYEDGIIRIPGLILKKIYNYRFVNPINRKVEKWVQDFNPDVIHVHTDVCVAIFARLYASKHKVPLVYTYHTMYEDYTSYLTGGHFERIARASLRWWSKSIISETSEFIIPSLKTKDYIRAIGVDNYVNVIPTGIDFSKFDIKAVGSKKVQAMKQKLGINADTKVFLSLGRLGKEKSVDVVIKGYAEFVNKYPDIKSILLVVGGGPSAAELAELADSLGISNKTKFLGPCNNHECPLYYNLADIFVSASITETQGLTYMEAMASNVTVFARYDSNLLDVIVDKKTGFFFNDENDFAIKAKEVLDYPKDKTDEIHKNALKYIDNYSIDKFYKRVKNVYERAVRKNW